MVGTTSSLDKAGPDAKRTAGRGPADQSQQPLSLAIYRTVTRLARPAAPLILRHRLKRGKEDPARLGERLGASGAARPPGTIAWVHAASVGEANSVLPLIDAMGAHRPDIRVLLTTGTTTSAKSVAERLPAGAIHQYVPLDSPRFVARFLDHWRPSLAVFTEQEIWPNLIVESASRGIPLAMINARMSAASFERWRRRETLARALFQRFEVVLAQDETFRERLAVLGARTARNAGNLKFDAPPPPVVEAARASLEAALAGRPRLIAASTHPGEEVIIAAAHRMVAAEVPGLATIIAPRHPERGAALVGELRALGADVARRSAGELPGPGTDLYVADTIGELGTLYATAPVAFIGGSLIPHGGQNPIEAVRHGLAVLTGPHWSNFEGAYRALLANGGAYEVHSAEELARSATGLFRNPDRLAAMRTAATAALAGLGGALERTLAALLPLLPDADGAAEAARA